jgi:hypothetical protein
MRWLKVLVIGMGILILVGLTVVIVAVVKRANVPADPASSVGLPSPPIIGAPRPSDTGGRVSRFGDKRVAIPAGAVIEEIISATQRLIVRLRLSNGKAALLLIDPASGEKIGLILLDEEGQ